MVTYGVEYLKPETRLWSLVHGEHAPYRAKAQVKPIAVRASQNWSKSELELPAARPAANFCECPN